MPFEFVVTEVPRRLDERRVPALVEARGYFKHSQKQVARTTSAYPMLGQLPIEQE